MAEHSRLEDLRRRVEKDPASIAFAQLAEEYRRGGHLDEAIQVCRAGLEIHPGYLSARVTLGRALIELNDLESARGELEYVLQHAPENLAAIRGLAEIHHRSGHLPEALDKYRAALALARNDPDLERTVEELARKVTPEPTPAPPAAVPVEEEHEPPLANTPPAPEPVASLSVDAPDAPARTDIFDDLSLEQTFDVELSAIDLDQDALETTLTVAETEAGSGAGAANPLPPAAAPLYNGVPDATRDRAHRTIAALEQWLDALNVSRTHCGA